MVIEVQVILQETKEMKHYVHVCTTDINIAVVGNATRKILQYVQQDILQKKLCIENGQPSKNRHQFNPVQFSLIPYFTMDTSDWEAGNTMSTPAERLSFLIHIT